ncbi:uncharacterized protein LOC144864726 [Branchiostoma floridae x Branchiostoma japonicum]
MATFGIKTSAEEEMTKGSSFQGANCISSSNTGTSINLGGCDPHEKATDTTHVPRHPLNQGLNTILPDPMHVPKARDPNPTYKQTAPTTNQTDTVENDQNPNPIYPENAPPNQPSSDPESDALSSVGDDPNTQSSAVSHPKDLDDEPTSKPASKDCNTEIQVKALATYQNDGELASKQTKNESAPCIPAYAVNHLQDDAATDVSARSARDVCRQAYVASTHENVADKPTSSDDDLHIQPYAVRYQENDDDNIIPSACHTADDNDEQIDDVKPYAVAYMSQNEEEILQDNRRSDETRPKETLQEANTVSHRSNDIPTGLARGNSSKNDAYTSAQDALKPNPMYKPNIRKEPAFANLGCTYRRVCIVVITAAFLVLLIFGWTFALLYFNQNNQDTQMPTSAEDTTYSPGGQPTCCSLEGTGGTALSAMPTVSSATINPRNVTLPPSANSSQSATLTLASNSSPAATLTSTNISSGATPPTTINIPHGVTLPSTTKRSQLSPIFNTSQGTHGVDSPTEKIIFGGTGSDPGKFRDNRAVAVSADNEIFVTDKRNKRVQVFNINGDFLRLFPTFLMADGEEKILPSDVSIDGEGHLWVVGRTKKALNAPVHVVQYNRSGMPLTTFGVPGPTWSVTVAMAVDVRNDKIIVILFDEILMFQPNGSFCQSIGKGLHQYEYATTDNSGRILVTDYANSKVQVFNNTGYWLFGFPGLGRGDVQLILPKGVCMDVSGRVIVANDGNGRIDMFTSRGEFVRTVVEMDKSWGIAVGPDGHLVVTNVYDNTVTIFPPTMMFP